MRMTNYSMLQMPLNTTTLTTSRMTNQTESTTPTTQTDNPPTHT